MQIHKIPQIGYLSLNDIIGKKNQIPAIIPVGRTTWLEGVKSGKYPKPINLSKRRIAWKVEDIVELVNKINSQS